MGLLHCLVRSLSYTIDSVDWRVVILPAREKMGSGFDKGIRRQLEIINTLMGADALQYGNGFQCFPLENRYF